MADEKGTIGEALKAETKKEKTEKDFNIVLYGTLNCVHCIEMLNRIQKEKGKHPEIKFSVLNPVGSMKHIQVTKLRYGNDLVKTVNGAVSEEELGKLIDEFMGGKMEVQPKSVEEAEEPKTTVAGPSSPLLKKVTITWDARTLNLMEVKPENTVITEIPTLLRRTANILSAQLENPPKI